MGGVIINLIAFLAMVFINAWANMGRLGGETTGEISSQFQNLFTPAGWTFSIWGAIYLLIGIFAVASLFNANAQAVSKKIGNWFWISCVFNILWLLTWHSKLIVASMAMMIGLLVSLIAMAIKLTGTFSLFTAGFSLYLGWIMVATLANFTVTMVSLGMDGMGSMSQIWTTAVLPLAALIIATVVYFKIDWVIGAAGMFAFLGIIFRQISANGLAAKYPGVLTAAIVGFVIISISTLFIAIYNKPFIRFAFKRS